MRLEYLLSGAGSAARGGNAQGQAVAAADPVGTKTRYLFNGELAQLARALALQARGQGFDSLILH